MSGSGRGTSQVFHPSVSKVDLESFQTSPTWTYTIETDWSGVGGSPSSVVETRLRQRVAEYEPED